jgi:ATP-dependent helicase HrpB
MLLADLGKTNLPVFHSFPALITALTDGHDVVLEASPGAGKTTLVPLALYLSGVFGKKKLIMLEPRRIAVRSAARRMSSLLGESVGQTVGYRTRLETCLSSVTRIEVVTEGILTRIIQNNPLLDDYGVVIFDEFHERNLPSDLGLALVKDIQTSVRKDLRVLLMSATLEGQPLSDKIGAVHLLSEGQSFPVRTVYTQPPQGKRLEEHVASVALDAVEAQEGDVLVFLPGIGEIRRTERILQSWNIPGHLDILQLYGDLPPSQQDAVLNGSVPGRRRIILSTSLAESSLTVPGVSAVVDAGLARTLEYDPNSGMNRLVTRPVSLASANQRRGRAGRERPGICYRCWSEFDEKGFAKDSTPEILISDLSGLVLELAGWGVQDLSRLFWIDSPPLANVKEAQRLLAALDAVDDQLRITKQGREMLEQGLHPRLARFVISGRKEGWAEESLLLAALLEEGDFYDRTSEMGVRKSADLLERLETLQGMDRFSAVLSDQERSRAERILATFRKMMAFKREEKGKTSKAGTLASLLAAAYPDRIAVRGKDNRNAYQLSNGKQIHLDPADPLSHFCFLVVPEIEMRKDACWIRLAMGIPRLEFENISRKMGRNFEEVYWDYGKKRLLAVSEFRLGEIVLRSEPIPNPDRRMVNTVLLEMLKKERLAPLPWTEETRDFISRVGFLHFHAPSEWPDFSVEGLLPHLQRLLDGSLDDVRKESDLKEIPFLHLLKEMLGFERCREMERLAPLFVRVPSGSRIRIDYSDKSSPSLEVRIQELFGLQSTPFLLDGKIPLRIKLLSPALRPIQMTSDLESFWKNTYPEVRKELRIRYPKHYWPENPYEAEAIRGVRPRR